MKKTTLSLVVTMTLLLSSTLSLQAQSNWNAHCSEQKAKSEMKAPAAEPGNIFLGHTTIDNQIWPYDGLSLSYDSRVGVGAVLTRDMFEPYIGGKIAYMIVGWDDQASNNTYDCFVRAGGFNSENITTGSGSVEFGWNIIELENAEIPDAETLCIGFYTNIKKDVVSIPFLYPMNVPNSVFLYSNEYDADGNELWYDMHSTPGFGIMPIILVLEDAKGQFVNMVNVESIRYNNIVYAQEVHDAVIKVTNTGSNSINQIEVTTKFGEDEMTELIELEDPILTGSYRSLRLPIYCLGSGMHEISISRVNQARARGNNTVYAEMVGVPYELEGQYTHRPVIEYFVSEESYMHPKYYDDLFYPGFKAYEDKYTLIMPHIDDKYMTGDNDAVAQMLTLVDNDSLNVIIPSYTINRSDNLEYLVVLEGTVFHNGIPFPEALDMNPMYANILKKPTFASVNVEAQYTENFEGVNITVSGDVAGNVLPEGESLFLTVYLLERNVKSMDQLFWDDKEDGPSGKEFIHKTIIRDILSDFWGNELSQASGEYTQSFSVELDPEWNTDNLYIAAFLNRNVENTEFNRNIINSNECNINAPEAVTSIKPGKDKITTENGTIYMNGCSRNVEVYNLAGARLNNKNLPAGIYLIQHNDTRAKVLVK